MSASTTDNPFDVGHCYKCGGICVSIQNTGYCACHPNWPQLKELWDLEGLINQEMDNLDAEGEYEDTSYLDHLENQYNALFKQLFSTGD